MSWIAYIYIHQDYRAGVFLFYFYNVVAYSLMCNVCSKYRLMEVLILVYWSYIYET